MNHAKITDQGLLIASGDPTKSSSIRESNFLSDVGPDTHTDHMKTKVPPFVKTASRRPGEPPPEPLTEPDLIVSHHPALLYKPSGACPFPSERRDWVWFLQPSPASLAQRQAAV